MMTEAQILSVPLSRPGQIFPKDLANLRHRFAELVKRWHPDNPEGSARVLDHLVKLKDEAERRLKAGQSINSDQLLLEASDGRIFKLRHRREHRFELGTMYVAPSCVTFLTEKQHGQLYLNAIKRVGSFSYPDKDMREQHEKFLPKVRDTFATSTHDVTVIQKTGDAILLRDLISHVGGTLDAKHVCWIVSSLLSMASLFQIMKLAHNALSIDTVFVSPRYHSAIILGGWWYARPFGRELTHLPPSTHAIAPRKLLRDKKATGQLDLESIRAIARTSLGGSAGMASLPKPFQQYLQLPAPASAVEDYMRWEQVRSDSFGPRRFIKLSVEGSDVYP
jgi:hypothetical protein